MHASLGSSELHFITLHPVWIAALERCQDAIYQQRGSNPLLLRDAHKPTNALSASSLNEDSEVSVCNNLFESFMADFVIPLQFYE